MEFTAKIFPAEEGGYCVEFPDVPGVYTCGETLEKCKKYAAEALNLWLESVLDDDMEMPVYKTKPCESECLYAVEVDVRLATALAIHEARKGLKSSVVAKRMRMSPQAFVRLQKSSSNVSVAMLDRFAKAVGKKLVVDFV